jgi:hypothetical protein
MRSFARRFFASYFAIYLFPFPAGYLPHGEQLDAAYQSLWNRSVAWLAQRLFHVTLTVFTNGSGDTTYNYFQLPLLVLFALAVAGVWTLAAKGAPLSQRAEDAVRFYVRFGLGAALIGYGCAKFFAGQFPVPDAARLMQPIGTVSPMGLLWRFMGASKVYAGFGGVLEIGAGLMLFWRRTFLAGAISAAAVMLNVVMLNFSYDVPVKIYSTHLFLMAVYLAAAGRRLFGGGFEGCGRDASRRPLGAGGHPQQVHHRHWRGRLGAHAGDDPRRGQRADDGEEVRAGSAVCAARLSRD